LEAEVSASEVNPILIVGLVSDIKPKTKIKIKGNPKLKITALGLLRIASKLAFAIASSALR